jgi:THAP4-like, heme-binding beta-barrel domain
MNENMLNMNQLSFLAGTWKGKGTAEYPTIKTVEYSEELIFNHIEGFDVLQYEQKTWIKNEKDIFDKPIFWDCGFIINREEGSLELCSAQKSGRLEILSGKLILKSNGVYEVSFDSLGIYNDGKTIKSGRKFILSNSFIQYELWMSTTTHPGYGLHLKASLKKQLY